MTDKRADAEAVAEAHGLDTLPEAIDYLTDDRSHGDELIAEIAARIARERWAGQPPKGNRKTAVEFIIECQDEGHAEAERQLHKVVKEVHEDNQRQAADDTQFRRDLRTMEKNNKEFFSDKKNRHGRKA